MNLYNYHSKPETIHGHDRADKEVPSIFWGKYQPDELKKREAALAKSPEYAYLYAKEVLHGRFPKGEDAIAKDPLYAYKYHQWVLANKPFPKGEKAILGSSLADAYKMNLRIYKDKE